MKHTVLLVEDDATLAMIVADTLSRDGFEVVNASNGCEGLRACEGRLPDLVIADVMMPGIDGFEMVRRIRRLNNDVPIIFLTARSGIDDVVEGFECGANDYLRKPFKMLELLVRVKALLRMNVALERAEYTIGSYTFRVDTQTLEHAYEGRVELSAIESLVLKSLVQNLGATVEASELKRRIWQRDDPWSRNSLHGFIHKLRHYLRHDPSVAIINQRGIGYMLTAGR